MIVDDLHMFDSKPNRLVAILFLVVAPLLACGDFNDLIEDGLVPDPTTRYDGDWTCLGYGDASGTVLYSDTSCDDLQIRDGRDGSIIVTEYGYCYPPSGGSVLWICRVLQAVDGRLLISTINDIWAIYEPG